MALTPIAVGDTGASVRAKINAGLSATDTKADAAALSAEITNRQNAVNGEAAARATAVANETLARAAADTAEANARAAAVTGEANARAAAISSEAAARVAGDKAGLDSLLLNIGRPGDRPDLFTYELTGFPDATAALSAANVVTVADGGRVYRLTGGSIVARRAMWRIEPGRRYRVRGVLRRVANVLGSPSDIVVFGVQVMNASAGDVSRPDLGAGFSNLAVGQRVTADVVVSTVAGAGVDAVLPSNTVYVRPYWWINTTTCTNDIESVEDIIDVTDYGVLTPDLTGLTSRVAGIESQQPYVVEQVLAAQAAAEDALEQAQAANAAPSISYDTLAELQASAPPGGGSWPDGVNGYVLIGPDVGSYIRDSTVAGNWRLFSRDTLPAVAARTASLEAPLSGYEETPVSAPITVFDDLEKKTLMDVDSAGEFDFLPRESLARRVAAKIPPDAKIRAEEIEISAVSYDDEHPIRSLYVDERDGSGVRRRLAGVNRAGEWNILLDQESIENVSAGRAALSPTIGRVDARAPNRNDDASRGYAVGDIWPFEKRIWQNTGNTNERARWTQKPTLPLAGAVVTSGLQAMYALRREVPGYTGPACTIRRVRGGVTTDLNLYFLRSGRLDTSPVKAFTTYINEASQVVVDEAFIVAVHDQTGNHGPMVFQESYGGQTWQPPLLTPLDYFGSNPGIQFPQTFTGDDVTPRYTTLVLPSTITSGTRSFSVVSLAQFIHIGQNSPIIQLTASNPDSSAQLLFSENTSRLGLTIFSGNYARGFSNTHKPPVNRPGVFAMTSGTTSKIYAEENLSASFSALANTTFAGGCIGATTYPLDGAGKPGAAGSVTIGAIAIYNRELSAVEVRAVQESLYAEWQIARQTRGGVHVIVGDSIARAVVKDFQGWYQQIGPLLKTQSRIYNCAFGGSTFGGSLPNIYLWQSCYDPDALFNIVHLCWATNDIAQDLSFDTILANALAMIAAVKAYHPWDIALWTVIPRGGFTDGTRQAVCDQWNAYLRANWRAMGASLLIDIAADPIMGAPNWWTTMEGAFDSTHPPPAGHARYALVGAEAVNDWVLKNFEHY